MRKLITAICVLIMFLQSCKGSKKATQLPPYIIPDLPYGVLGRKGTESSNNKEILLYFINDQTLTLRPGQITEAEFWASPENLDTLKLKDSEYIAKFNLLQDTILYSSNEVDLFPHVFAFVFQTDKRPDTLYANRELTLFEWKGKKKFYKDTTSFFTDKFYAISNVN